MCSKTTSTRIVDPVFVIRHGGFNKIRNNLFIGSGGIRVYGSDSNEIRGNYHKNNSSSEKPPLVIAMGVSKAIPISTTVVNPEEKRAAAMQFMLVQKIT